MARSEENYQEEKEKDFFGQIEVDFKESKADIWSRMEENLIEKKEEKGKIIRLNKKWVSLAAIGMLLIGAASFMRLYTVEVKTGNGEFLTEELPDGSTVELNAGSELAYQPYWWLFDRNVTLEGEGFFEVEKGSRFAVHSQNGMTEVLGTSFNVYTRMDEYRVYCATGKVRVSDKSDHSVLLVPGEMAALSNTIELSKSTPESGDENLSWRMGMFIYNTTPLTKVMADLERHYSVEIIVENLSDSLKYTGLFKRSIGVENALNIIGANFNMKVEKTEANKYLVH